MNELKSSKKIEFSDLLYCRNVLIAFPFAVIWTRYYKFKRLQRIYLLHMDRMETYSYLISICFVLPPEPIKNFRSFQIEQQKILFKSVVLFFIFICVFCLLKYLSKCLVNLAWFSYILLPFHKNKHDIQCRIVFQLVLYRER